MLKPCLISMGAAACCLSMDVMAQPVPDYGFNWSTIGSPGNRPTIPSEVPFQSSLRVGAVDYEYRLSRTEVTAGQFLEFAEAYVRWHPEFLDDPQSGELLGDYIGERFDGTLALPQAAVHAPNVQSWRMAARYCNWLHNGKEDAAWAFESGAYDASTFVELPGGGVNDQVTRSPGARFWIPSRDEWVKGAYFDPHRYGEGQEGYWSSPNGTNEILISGFAVDGAETNGGILMNLDLAPMEVGSYPQVISPWGLLDISGGEREWTEDLTGGPMDAFRNRRVLGSGYGLGDYFLLDRPDSGGITFPPFLLRPGYDLPRACQHHRRR